MKRAAAALLAAAATAVHAGRPLTTEDASVLEDKACQVESWIDHSRAATQAWAVPACNFGAGIEWQAGFARSRESGESFYSETYVQAKKVIVAPEPGSWGYGWVAGISRFPRRETYNRYDDPFVTIPVTVMPNAETLIHLNVGWSYDRAERQHTATWGVAGERTVATNVVLLGEVWAEDRRQPFGRVGTRVTVAKGLDLDLTVVGRRGGDRSDRYISLGFTWQSTPFLP